MFTIKISLFEVLKYFKKNDIALLVGSFEKLDDKLVDDIIQEAVNLDNLTLQEIEKTLELFRILRKSKNSFTKENIINICKFYKKNKEKIDIKPEIYGKYLSEILKDSEIDETIFIEYYEVLKSYSKTLKKTNPEIFQKDEVKLLEKISKPEMLIHYRRNLYKSFKNLTPKIVEENPYIVNWNYLIENEKEIPKEYLDIIATMKGFLPYSSYAYINTYRFVFENFRESKLKFINAFSINFRYLDIFNFMLKLTEEDFISADGITLYSYIRAPFSSFKPSFYDKYKNKSCNASIFELLRDEFSNAVSSNRIKGNLKNASFQDYKKLFEDDIRESFISEKYKEYLKLLKSEISRASGMEFTKLLKNSKYFDSKKDSKTHICNDLLFPDFLKEEILCKMEKRINSLIIKE